VLPTFLVIGAMKGATSSLARYLAAHPDVFMTRDKEPDFFSRRFRLGQEWYESLFDGAAGAVARGEASPSYTFFPLLDAAPRIAEVVPEARLVYLVRDPVDRMHSQYLHYRRAGWESEPLRKALLGDARYTYPSRYGMQLERYAAAFPRQQILVVRSSALRDERAETMKRIFTHIGVDPERAPTAEGEFNVADTSRAPRPGWARLRTATSTRPAVARLAPRLQTIESRFPRAFTRPFAEDELEMPDDLRARLDVMLRADVAALRDWIGDEVDALR
jgi:sulfotransferase family protein